MKIDILFPSKFFKAADLGGQSMIVTIESVIQEALGDGKEMKAVVYFRAIEKGLVLNKTNADPISMISGFDDTDNWAGLSIGLYATPVSFQGKLVDSIRVSRLPKEPVKPPVPARTPDDGFDGPEDGIPFST